MPAPIVYAPAPPIVMLEIVAPTLAQDSVVVEGDFLTAEGDFVVITTAIAPVARTKRPSARARVEAGLRG